MNTEPLGTTTARSDFQQWELPARHVRPGLPASQLNLRFQPQTTSRMDFPPPPNMAPPKERPPHKKHIVAPFLGTTEHRASFEQMQLPSGNHGAIGLQIASKPYAKGGVGGQFELMIREGAPAPQQATKVFTTVVDDQTSAAIVVVTKRRDRADGVVLGYFTMEGIGKAPTGVPKVEVSLKLSSEKILDASATYVQGNKRKALRFTSGTGPSLRYVTDATKVPEGM